MVFAVSVTLRHDQITTLEEWQDKSELNRSEIVRNALDAYAIDQVESGERVKELEAELEDAKQRLEEIQEENTSLKARLGTSGAGKIIRPWTTSGVER